MNSLILMTDKKFNNKVCRVKDTQDINIKSEKKSLKEIKSAELSDLIGNLLIMEVKY